MDSPLSPTAAKNTGLVSSLSMNKFTPDEQQIRKALGLDQVNQPPGVVGERSAANMPAGGPQFGSCRGPVPFNR